MEKRTKEGVEWFEFELLQEISWIKHGSLTRHGGISTGEYKSLNIGYGIGDLEQNVAENLHRVVKVLGLAEEPVYADQVHGIEVIRVKNKKQHLPTPKCDAFVTDLEECPLMVKHADCQAAIFVDPINRAVGVAHSGWRGSVQNIYKAVVERMKWEFRSKAENLLVAISPSLGPQAAEFVNYKTELPEMFWDFQVKPHYFDFWAISKEQLKDLGIKEDHIQIAEKCTYSNKDDFFSYRRENKTGRHGTIIQIQKRS